MVGNRPRSAAGSLPVSLATATPSDAWATSALTPELHGTSGLGHPHERLDGLVIGGRGNPDLGALLVEMEKGAGCHWNTLRVVGALVTRANAVELRNRRPRPNSSRSVWTAIWIFSIPLDVSHASLRCSTSRLLMIWRLQFAGCPGRRSRGVGRPIVVATRSEMAS